MNASLSLAGTGAEDALPLDAVELVVPDVFAAAGV
jgi:hypothetical protein